MGALKPVHLLILILVVVILFGWKRLPDAARSLGRSMRIFKSEVEEMKKDGQDNPSAASGDTVKGETVHPKADPNAERPWNPTVDSTVDSTGDPTGDRIVDASEREKHNQPPA